MGTVSFTNFVKMFAFVKNNYIHLLLFVLLLTISDNVLPFLPIKLVAIAQGAIQVSDFNFDLTPAESLLLTTKNTVLLATFINPSTGITSNEGNFH